MFTLVRRLIFVSLCSFLLTCVRVVCVCLNVSYGRFAIDYACILVFLIGSKGRVCFCCIWVFYRYEFRGVSIMWKFQMYEVIESFVVLVRNIAVRADAF